MRYLPILLLGILGGLGQVYAAQAGAESPQEELLKVSLAFKDDVLNCQMVLTRDSVGILELDSTAGALEPDDENGFDGAIRKRALSPAEKDSVQFLMDLTRKWKGRQRYFCASADSYAFTIWSDSLTLHCENCFSCSEGVGIAEARKLALFGKLSLWLYRMRDAQGPGWTWNPSRVE